jgi:hypothetical protein
VFIIVKVVYTSPSNLTYSEPTCRFYMLNGHYFIRIVASYSYLFRMESWVRKLKAVWRYVLIFLYVIDAMCRLTHFTQGLPVSVCVCVCVCRDGVLIWWGTLKVRWRFDANSTPLISNLKHLRFWGIIAKMPWFGDMVESCSLIYLY